METKSVIINSPMKATPDLTTPISRIIMLRLLDVNWSDMMNKAVYIGLVVGSAYASVNPKWAWLGAAFTALTGIQKPPITTKIGTVRPA